MPLFPGLRQAVRDPAIRGNAAVLYIFLLDHLDFVEFRPVKVLFLHRALRLRVGTVRDLLRKLTQLGYLELGPSEGQLNTYRITYNPGRSQTDLTRAS
jgi:hypothetical protein